MSLHVHCLQFLLMSDIKNVGIYLPIFNLYLCIIELIMIYDKHDILGNFLTLIYVLILNFYSIIVKIIFHVGTLNKLYTFNLVIICINFIFFFLFLPRCF